jgi:mono/diheme cytochrome c family protein
MTVIYLNYRNYRIKMRRTMNVKPKIMLVTAALVATMAAAGCNTPTTNTAPAGHTVNKNGVYHRPGLTDPLTNCVLCHGSDLKGGSGPSCFKCHGQKW